MNHYYNEEAKAENPDVPSANHVFADGDLGGLILVTATAVLDTNDQTSDAEELVGSCSRSRRRSTTRRRRSSTRWPRA